MKMSRFNEIDHSCDKTSLIFTAIKKQSFKKSVSIQINNNNYFSLNLKTCFGKDWHLNWKQYEWNWLELLAILFESVSVIVDLNH